MLESLYVSNNYCEVYDVEGTGHLKSDSSVIGDSKVADIIFVALTVEISLYYASFHKPR